MPSLADLYIGAGISKPIARGSGLQAGAMSSGAYFRTKRRTVLNELATGAKRQSQLGTSDLAVLGLGGAKKPKSNRSLPGGGFFKGVGGLFGNLGKDVADFTTGLPGGIVKLVGSAASDVFRMDHVLTGDSALYKNILKPTFEGYKHTYGQGNVLKNIYEHPLGPILDAATIASLGAGGAAKAGQVATRAGNTGRLADLARITARDGRPSINLPGGREIPREYTPRPLAKAGQIGLDKLGRVGADGGLNKLGEFQARRASAGASRMAHQEELGARAQNIAGVIRPLAETGRAMSDPDVSLAYALAIRGVNTPERLAAYQERVRTAMKDPEIVQKQEALGVPLAVQERRANLPERVQRLILDPTFEPESQAAMQAARARWESDVQRGHTQLEVDVPDIRKIHDTKIGSYQRELDGTEGTAAPDFAPGQIEPGYAPDIQANNLETFVPRGRLSKVVPFMKPGEEAIRVKGRTNRSMRDNALALQDVFVPRAQSYLHDASGETFFQGLFRADPQVWVDHAIQREKDIAERAFSKKIIEENALLGPDGQPRRFTSAEFNQAGLGATHVLTNPDFPMQWFRAETSFTKDAARLVNALKKEGDMVNANVVEQMLKNLTDADAKAFMSTHMMAMKKPGVAIPKAFSEYQRKILQVSDPFNNPLMRAYAGFMHHWRNTVLAYMPRWGLNTAIGSFVTNVTKGVVNPLDYVRGNRLGRTYLDEEGQSVTRPGMIGRSRLGGRNDLDFSSQRYTKMEPAGVSLQGEARQELLDSSAGRQASFPTEKLIAGVQHIEDFFRRASFQQSLRKNARQQAHEPAVLVGDVPHTGEALADVNAAPEGTLENMGDVVADAHLQIKNHNGDLESMLADEQLVRRSLRDTNKFGYNYGALGPDERRYVRQFMPFYGWYKFISNLAGRLPVEYPGRTAALMQLGEIGHDMQEELGQMPEWIKGSIILGVNADGTIRYLPTRGMNPFSSFFNPLNPGASLKQLTGMANPLIQAGAQAAGFDTLTGDSVRVSPQSGAGRDFLGNLVNDRGEQVAPGSIQPVARGLMALARSIPQYRLGEKYMLEGGGSVYPEHIPFGIQNRPMSPASGDALTSGVEAIGRSVVGINPRGYDLKKYQQLTRKRAQYIKKKNKRSIRKTEQKFAEAQ